MGRRSRKKKVVENIRITGIADKGKSVGRSETGEVIFMEDVAPGDLVDALVLRKRKGVLQAVPVAFHEYSKDRVEPFCSHFSECGGCKWQHLSYESQIHHKEQVVRNAMGRIGKVGIKEFLPIIGAKETQFYRNKLEFTFSNKRWLTSEEIKTDISNVEDVLGFHRAGAFDKILNIDKCFLQGDPSNKIRLAAKKIALEQELSFYDVRKNEGLLRNIIIRTSTLNEVMVILSLQPSEEDVRNKYIDALLAAAPEITSFYYVINPKVNDFLLDLDMVLYHGTEKMTEKLGDVKFEIGPKSFFQTNTKQAEVLYDKVVEFAGLTGNENVYDLYTGLGSIALYVADKCKNIVGVEEVEMAIVDAKANQKLNNIENADFYAGDVKDILTDEFIAKHNKPDLVITDPPRAGMHKQVVTTLLELAAPKIVYVSCNPATQARDIELLSAKYDVLKVQPVDMFPHTHHIESVALLSLR